MKHKTAKANVKTKTRLLSLLLAVLMTLFCFPVTAIGTDEAEEPISETLEETADAGLSAFERGVGELSPEALESMTLNAADVPEVISAQAIAEKDHVLRLREQEENLNTVVFQNRDGGKTVYLYANPVKYVDANGNVKDKSTALKAENITLNGKTYSHSATENVFGQYYPTMPQNGVLITFGQYTVEMAPVITGILTLRDTAVANNKVTYNKVFGNGTSLVYTPTLSGVKEDIILQTYTGKSSFSFTLKTNGLAIVQTESDTFLADFEGNKVASLGKVVITDKVGKTVYGTMTVIAVAEREEYTVTINAPTAFLTSATTVYPVTVDPTLTIDEEFTPDGDYYSAIEDLCVYDGTQDPNYDNIATIGTYATNATSAMLYRITADAWDYLAVDDYLDSGRFHSATLRVPVMNLTTGLTVATTPSLGSWTDGDSQSVDSMYFEDYYPDANSNTTTLTSTANNSGASIDVTKVFEYFATHPSAVNLGFMMYVTPSTAISNPQSSFGVYQVEEADTGVSLVIDYDVLDGNYYINSKTTGQFLSILNATSVDQSVYSTSKEQSWTLTFLGNDNYTISRTLQPNRVLVMDDSCNVFIGTKDNYDSDYYTWHFDFSANMATIYNVGAGEYLYPLSDGSISSSMNDNGALWRFCETSEFVPLSEIRINDVFIELDESTIPTIEDRTPYNAMWATLSDFTWVSSNTEIATISASGEIEGHKLGTTIVTASYNLNGAQYSFIVTVNIKSGIYFIKNDELAKFMQIDDNNSSIGSIIELWGFNGDNNQKWRFQHLDNGCYKITSLASNMSLTAPSVKDNSITQQTYTGSTSQQWKVSSNNGMYNISPLSNLSYYIAAGDGLIISDGRNVEMRSAQTDGKDEWNLLLPDEYIHMTLRARIFYDSSVTLTEEEIRQVYLEATAGFESKYYIKFNIESIEHLNALDIDPECHADGLNGICTSQCGDNESCGTLHHRSASRLIDVSFSNVYYTCRLVGYALCTYENGNHHDNYFGLGEVNGKDCIVSTLTTDPNMIKNRIQHELSHNLGATHDTCDRYELCILQGTFDTWCSKCEEAIKVNYN